MLSLSQASLDWSLAHALKYGYVEFFPPAFEFEAIKHDWPRIGRWLRDQNVLEWQTRPFRHCLSPKHRYGFRISTQLDPLDFLVYSALVHEVGRDLERRRVAATNQTVHSYRFRPASDGVMFDADYSYDTFLGRSAQLAQSDNYSFVVVADIADFFPRLYSHRVENALFQATQKRNHILALKNMIAQWNERYSYGIPVGTAASRLIAEVAIDDVDRALLAERAIYVRYSDDFRIFCTSERDAHERLAFLANVLFENHGLTVQQYKTTIVNIDEFTDRYLDSDERTTLKTLTERLSTILQSAGVVNSYDLIDWSDLPEEEQVQIDDLDLEDILREQAMTPSLDIQLTRFILRRLGQLNSSNALDIVLEKFDNLYPVFADVIRMAKDLRFYDLQEQREAGERFLGLLDNSLVSHLEFHRMWLLSLFSETTAWGNEDKFASLYNELPDQFSQRELILALGKSKQDYWFRSRKRGVFDLSPWLRRAFLAAASCLPTDERRHWYQSLEPRLDPLELAVVEWAKANPF